MNRYRGNYLALNFVCELLLSFKDMVCKAFEEGRFSASAKDGNINLMLKTRSGGILRYDSNPADDQDETN